MTKKEGVLAFRDPNCGVEGNAQYSKEIANCSPYPRIVFSHRIPYARYEWQVYSKWFSAIYRWRGNFHRIVKDHLPEKVVVFYYKLKK